MKSHERFIPLLERARGALLAIVFAFPLDALVALVYRFPVPFVGYKSGLNAIPLSLIGVAFYGMLGGFILLAGLGAIGGMLAYVLGKLTQQSINRYCHAFSLMAALLCVLLLAVLDKIIGPW